MTAAYWIVRLKRWCGIDLIGLLDRQLIYIPTQPSFALFTLMPGPMVEAMTQLLIY